jgi:hypothetical protein
MNTIYIAQVVSVKDPYAGGMIRVINPDVNGGSPIACYATSPTGGGGAGFFGIPGKGANVLITKATVSKDEYRWVWLSVVFLPGQCAPDKDGNPYSGDPSHMNRPSQGGLGDRDSGDTSPFYSHGNPDPLDTYADNGIPDVETWKSKGGHSITMSSKKTGERVRSGITIRTAGGKVLIMDDSPSDGTNGENPQSFPSLSKPSSEEYSKGARLILADEDGNRLHIDTANKLVELIGYGGVGMRAREFAGISIENPLSHGDIDITNNGLGGINISSNGIINIISAIPSVPIKIDNQPMQINFGVIINNLPVLSYG